MGAKEPAAPAVMKEEKETEGEISLAEFNKLSVKFERSTIATDEILRLLKGVALATSAVADALNANYATVYSRLKRLQKANKVQVRYKEKRAFWTLK